MLKLLLGALLLPAVTLAQPVILDKKAICDKTDVVLAEIAKSEFKEIPLWIGNSGKDTRVALIVNEKTKTWTIIQYNENYACILEIGQGFRFVQTEK